jgi:hypothetical protein
MSHFISTVNLLKSAASITASSQATGYEASHLAEPEFFYEAWRSTATTLQTIVVDHGAAKTMHRVVLFDTNFTLFTLEQHTSNVWTSPTFTSGPQAIGRDFYHRQYRRWYERGPNTPLTLRWTRIVIPAGQTTTDGAAYYRLGGLYFGAITGVPVAPRSGYAGGPDDPRLTLDADSGWVTQIEIGDPVVHQTWTRFASKNPLAPGLNDEWGEWLDIDRAIADAGGLFCHFVDLWGPGAVWMMRQENPNKWQDKESGFAAEDGWDLYECVAG